MGNGFPKPLTPPGGRSLQRTGVCASRIWIQALFWLEMLSSNVLGVVHFRTTCDWLSCLAEVWLVDMLRATAEAATKHMWNEHRFQHDMSLRDIW